MSVFDEIQVGDKVRVTNVFEGVVNRRDEETIHFGLMGFFKNSRSESRTWEIVEKTKPPEPTGKNAVILARLQNWGPEDSREAFSREHGGDSWWHPGGGAWPYAVLEDVTIVFEGGE